MQAHWQVIQTGQVVVSNSPQELWDNACKYFKWCDENYIESSVTLTSGKEAGKVVTDRKIRPYTIKGLCLHCGISEEYLKDMVANQDPTSEYSLAVNRIGYIIHTQNVENATVGIFNPIFTAKILNMDKDVSPSSVVRVEVIGGTPELSRSENQVLEKLELEKSVLEIPKEENSKEQFTKEQFIDPGL